MRALIIIFAFIATAYSLCIVNGRRYKENEKWKVNQRGLTLIKQCKKGKHGWKPEVVECIADGLKIPINKHVKIGEKTCYCEGNPPANDEVVGVHCIL